MTKQEKYLELVDRVKDDYSRRIIKAKEAVCMEWCEHCKTHINLWSYWQGSLDAKILLVGQDWGNFNPENSDDPKQLKLDRVLLQNLKKIDTGEGVSYFNEMDLDKERRFVTDKNIRDLFAELGDSYKSIDKNRNPDLFFTNLCLGYRSKGNSGSLKMSWLRNDEKYLVELVDIIQPQIIICLGKITYTEVAGLLGKSKVKADDFYEKLDTDVSCTIVDRGYGSARVFGVAHPGGMGVANRNTKCTIDEDKKTLSGMELQKRDWRRIGKYCS